MWPSTGGLRDGCAVPVQYGSSSATPAKRLQRVSSCPPMSSAVRCAMRSVSVGQSRAVGALHGTVNLHRESPPICCGAAYIIILLPAAALFTSPLHLHRPSHTLARSRSPVRGHPGPSRSPWPLTSRDPIVSGFSKRSTAQPWRAWSLERSGLGSRSPWTGLDLFQHGLIFDGRLLSYPIL